MSDVKQLLKEAKQELTRQDYAETIELSEKVLKLDPDNYFAHIFLGKALSSLPASDKFNPNHNLQKAATHYISATKLVPENLLAWKGLFLLFKTTEVIPDVLPYDEYFDLCGQYADILLKQEQSQIELINDIKLLKKTHPDCESAFYQHLKPGILMAETIGRHLSSPQDALSNLIKILSNREIAEIGKAVSQNRLKLKASDPDYQIKLNSFSWEIIKSSEIDQLYNQLVNILTDDQLRSETENEWLEYRIRVLRSMPLDIKKDFFTKVKDMIEDMVLVDHHSLLAWQKFFEWKDYEDLDNMDATLILKYFTKFPKDPLAMILYSWVSSKLSKYDIKSLESANKSTKGVDNGKKETDTVSTDEWNENQDKDEEKNEVKGQDENGTKEEDEEDLDDIEIGLLEDEVVTVLTENIVKCKNNILAHRIVCQYYLLTREYEAALPFIKTGISLIAYNIKDLGVYLPLTKREFSLDLATVYTYVDAPKDHNAALRLYDNILSGDPDSIQAKMGKGIIFIERKNWKDAMTLLTQVHEQSPDNLEVLSALSWSKAHMDYMEEALVGLDSVVKAIKGMDLRSIDFRALNLWRQAKVHIMKHTSINDSKQENIKCAFKLLIQSIKILDTFAPGFSTLGDIYCHYYKDQSRAFKCYFKAFDLDAGDYTAAKYITETYARKPNWQAASSIALRLIKGEKAKAELRSSNWPFRVAGIAHLENQEESDSIEWFQSALHVDPNDVESWVGLGQAYHACGRIEASIKVFDKAIELKPSHTYAQYFKAVSLCDMGEYLVSLEILEKVCQEVTTEETFQISLVDVLMKYSLDLYSQGFLLKSVAIANDTIERIKVIVTELKCVNQQIWICLSQVLRLFIWIESKVDSLPVESLVSIFEISEISGSEEIDSIDDIKIDTLLDSTTDDNVSIACKFLILASKYSISSQSILDVAGTVRASYWYNIGISELTTFITLKEPQYRDAAIFAFKKSIQLQSNTSETWIGLGIATMDINFRVSQHCFIKATALEPKATDIWFNLAMLGLKKNDTEFAQQVLNKLQSLAPQDSSPWIGMALILEEQGNIVESSRLFSHSFIISNGRSKAAQLLYAKNVLENHVGSGDDERDIETVEKLTTVSKALEQFFKKSPENPFALQCALLTLERLHHYEPANQLASQLTGILEKRFEKTQNEKELFSFGIIKGQFARIHLGLGNLELSIESADLSQGIIAESSDEKSMRTKISNHICLGLSYFFLNDFDQTLNQFQELLSISKESKHLVILIAKVLYDVGEIDTKETALQELTEYITVNGADLLITLTIAAISIMDGKREDLNIILDELEDLPLSSLIMDKHKDAPYLIEEITKRLYGDDTGEKVWQRSAYFFPNNLKVWERLNKNIQRKIASGGQNKVSAEEMSKLYCESKNLRSVQRSVFLCPWNATAVNALKECF
ncbi:ski3p [Saccharomyces arboricola H-6]|uniref:Ski3p n=1 Tax=Saccharomyces arboricola (strain H-6 / AS 2.3317 / CBS 10644) TaxID=1160507 RepID=J8PXS5_SACAR|nr:ski3p [Saccharomyces arboricola H-6]